MEEYLKRAEELKESVVGNFEHSTNIQDCELVEWLIEQAKKAHYYEKALREIADANVDTPFSRHLISHARRTINY